MISQTSVQAVLSLWDQEGLPAREIAERLNLPGGKVYYILRQHYGSGNARRHSESRMAASSETEPETHREFPGFGEGESQRVPPPSRCPGCGVLVQMPCLACWLAESGVLSPPPETGEAKANISCDLHGDELRRYLDLKHRKDFGLPISF